MMPVPNGLSSTNTDDLCISMTGPSRRSPTRGGSGLSSMILIIGLPAVLVTSVQPALRLVGTARTFGSFLGLGEASAMFFCSSAGWSVVSFVCSAFCSVSSFFFSSFFCLPVKEILNNDMMVWLFGFAHGVLLCRRVVRGVGKVIQKG